MKIKQISWDNIEGQFKESDGTVRIVWADGELLEMQSELFYGDWLPRVQKGKKLKMVVE